MQREQTQIRMDVAMKKRVHKYMEKFERTHHAKIGFSEAVRVLLLQSLERENIP